MDKISELNCETGELVVRDLTNEEKLFFEAGQVADTEASAIRQSALTKLQALGLTEEEVKALLS